MVFFFLGLSFDTERISFVRALLFFSFFSSVFVRFRSFCFFLLGGKRPGVIGKWDYYFENVGLVYRNTCFFHFFLLILHVIYC